MSLTRSTMRRSPARHSVHAVYRTRSGLTPEALEVLAAGRYAVLGTVSPDESAHVVPLMYCWDGQRLLMETSAATRKARNVRRTGRATVLVTDPRCDGEAWVCGSGPAEVVTGAHAAALGRRIRARYLTPAGEEQVGSVMARYDDAVVAVTPQRWLAWDTTALLETFAAHGVDLARAGEWYRAPAP